MKSDSIQDSTRYVVSNLHHGSILPGSRAEMQRDVFLLSNAEIKGGIWANDLLVRGENIKVEKSIFTKRSLTIDDDDKGKKVKPIDFQSSVVASESIVRNDSQTPLKFQSDIYTNKLNISNAFVMGNIYADQAIIKNSIVLGGIYCKNSLNIGNSMFSTFRTNKVILGNNLYMFFPVALSEEPIEVKDPIKSLTFLNLFQSIKKVENTGIILLDNDDVFKVDENYLGKNESEDKNELENYVEKDLYCLSLSERILNTNTLVEHLKFNKSFIEKIALSSHYKEETKTDVIDKPIEELEKILWDLLNSKKKLNEISSTTTIDKMFTT